MLRDMQSEIKQGKPFVHPEEELFLSLIRTADILGRNTSDLLKEQGLSTAQYNVLRILRGAGPKGLSCGEINARMITRDPDVTRLLDRLEFRKLISRARDPGDRRIVSVCISSEGLTLLEPIDQPMIEIHKKQLGFLSPEEIREVLNQLARIRENMEAAE